MVKVVLGPWAIEVNKLDELPKIVPMYCDGDQIASPCITYAAVHTILKVDGLNKKLINTKHSVRVHLYFLVRMQLCKYVFKYRSVPCKYVIIT